MDISAILFSHQLSSVQMPPMTPRMMPRSTYSWAILQQAAYTELSHPAPLGSETLNKGCKFSSCVATLVAVKEAT